MPGRPDTAKKAAGLREQALFAARAGRRQEAHAALLGSLAYDPHDVSTLSLLAATAPTESDAERYRAQAAEGIHQSSRRKPLSAKTRPGQVPPPRVREAAGVMQDLRLRSSEQTVHKSYQGLAVTRMGELPSGTPDDSLEHYSLELLADAGRAVAHYVLVLGSR